MKRLAAILVAVATITTVGAQQSSTPTARAPQVTFTKDVAPMGALDQAEGRRA